MANSFHRSIGLGILCAVLAGLVCSAMADQPAVPISAQANQSQLGKANNTSLEQVLAAGLKCRRPVEFDYVKMVAKRVENGTLPHTLVESTFFWARRQPDQYPYISFRYALELRAKRMGIKL